MDWLSRRYLVSIEGRGFALPLDGREAVGFFIKRYVNAASPQEASKRSVELLTREPGYVARLATASCPPSLRVDEVQEVGWLAGRFRRAQGFVFYAAEAADANAMTIRLSSSSEAPGGGS